MGIFSNAKDRLIETAVPGYLNKSYLAPYGSITSFKIDTTARSMEVELQLNGETQPVSLHVHEFSISDQGGDTFVRLEKVSTSREWLTKAAQDFLVGRPFKLPPEAARAVKSVL